MARIRRGLDATSSPVRTATPTKATPSKPTPTRELRNGTTPKKTDSTPLKAVETVNGAKDAAVSSPAAAGKTNTEKDTDGSETAIDGFKTHRVDKDAATVEFLVNWADGEASWEPEWSLQDQVPNLVFEYWDAKGGREEATGFDTYHVFKILKRTMPSSGNQPQYQIQWVGYRRKESTWEPEDKVRKMAPEELKEYEANHPLPAASAGQKRPSGRGPGRPRKKVKTAVNGE